uniref:Cytochrome P450, family 3, subfamily A, polypeptide 65 n=1 Tax=Hucho hucho TaxID=62062 RepID=A0A4W5RN90_9TELE
QNNMAIYSITWYLYWPYGVFTKMDIPGPKPLPYFGTMMEYKKGFTNFDTECFQKYGRIWGIYDGRQPVLCTMDKSMIKTVLIKECYNIFTNRRLFDAVSVAEDDTWRRIRSVLSPSFTSGRLKEVELSLHLSLSMFYQLVINTTLSTKISSIFFVAVYLPPQTDAGILITLNELYKAIRKQENAHPEAALQVAGDVTCATRIFSQEEIDTVFPNKSLRLYPIMLRLERVAKKTVEINGIVIPKDCVVLVPTWALHRDLEIWSDPEEFKPERFSKENKESIDPYTYMPFGAGPRNCIGMRFALIMIKLAIVEILQSLTFSVCDETEVRRSPEQTSVSFRRTLPYTNLPYPRVHTLPYHRVPYPRVPYPTLP